MTGFGIRLGLGSRSAADPGQALLMGSLFWGSSLDATSPDREVDLLAISPYELRRMTTVDGVAGPDGALTARRYIPQDYSGYGSGWRVQVTYTAPGLTTGVKTTAKMVVRPSQAMCDVAPSTRSLSLWDIGALNTCQQWDNTEDEAEGAGFSLLTPWPNRQLCYKRGDGWQAWISEKPAAANHSAAFQPWQNGDSLTVAGAVDGFDVAEWKYFQSPLATLPNRASGATAASVASETTAPLLERPLAPDQQYAGAWVDRSRAIRFLGQATEAVNFANVSALNGTDADFSITFAFSPSAIPDSDCDIIAITGTTASIRVQHLSTGYVKLIRTADDGTSISVTFDRMLGLVPHVWTVQVRSGVASVWSQGVQWGTTKAFTSGKVATFTGGKLGGSLWHGLVAEVAIAPRSYSAAEIVSVHATLCIRRSLPVGARETWLIQGQSNSMANGLGARAPEWAPAGVGRGIHSEYADAPNTWYAYGGQVRTLGHDRRKTSDTSQGAFNSQSMNFGPEWTLHGARHNIATIRFGWGGQGTEAFAPGGAYHDMMIASFDAQIERIGVPLSIRGVLFVNGESDSDGAHLYPGTYTANMNALFGDLSSRYGATVAILRWLPYSIGSVGAMNRAGVDQVRAEQAAWVAADPTHRAKIVMDDDLTNGVADYAKMALWWDDWDAGPQPATGVIHGGAPQRWAEGQRFAAAIASLGL